MKPFPAGKPAILTMLTLLLLPGCNTLDGIQSDLSDLGGNFSNANSNIAATESTNANQTANFLVDGNCPQIEVVGELSMLYEFETPNTTAQDSLISASRIADAQSTCKYGERSVTVDLRLAFDNALGPKGRIASSDKPFFSQPYFVAVTSGAGKILAKEIFAASFSYDGTQSARTYQETLRQIIPADSRAEGGRYKVMVGFQLTKDQLEYNRQVLEQRRKAEIAAAKQAEKMAAAQAPAAGEEAPQGSIVIEPTPMATPSRAGPIDITSPE